MAKVNTAPIKWAQRSDSLYITIALPDVKEASVDLADETLKFKGKSESKEYEVDIAFFKPVDSKGSTYNVLPRSVVMHVMKKDKEEEEFWPRLLKDKALEKNQVKIDWDRYVDEDEEEEGFDTSALDGGMDMGSMMGGGGGGMPGGMPGGMDMASMMQGMGGMGGMPGMGGAGGAGGMPGGMDMEALMKQMGQMGGGGGADMMGGDDGEPDSDDDDSDDDLPELEDS
mmetsp:Transcript_21664/g.33968  ORF Transcript_21664/g.33968 Transcript_21664/m.33968 type:complete len:227 (+) Transcript_21664:150-830(+)|eukprot:CAMPEP_0201713316 /NCGR_PEP_ID=MMETSP0593-20130828/203_1 /ASSEMBLY_ACC=CAM_ASM_000672 /TAXON_ID=267983 /ORGANISM="Skeletonema japonicum, Strain CCMP2506" /LENGTH=226 /DNA_ID=CAMNT_0048202451 /DNA_START=137 /DNA_END=817 /DNA_ORIENTATION=-